MNEFSYDCRQNYILMFILCTRDFYSVFSILFLIRQILTGDFNSGLKLEI